MAAKIKHVFYSRSVCRLLKLTVVWVYIQVVTGSGPTANDPKSWEDANTQCIHADTPLLSEKRAHSLCIHADTPLLSEKRAHSLESQIRDLNIGDFFWINAKDFNYSKKTNSGRVSVYLRFGVDDVTVQRKGLCSHKPAADAISPTQEEASLHVTNGSCTSKGWSLYDIDHPDKIPLSVIGFRTPFWFKAAVTKKNIPDFKGSGVVRADCLGMLVHPNRSLSLHRDNCNTPHPYMCEPAPTIRYNPTVMRTHGIAPLYTHTPTDVETTPTIDGNATNLFEGASESDNSEEQDGADVGELLGIFVPSCFVIICVILLVFYINKRKKDHRRYLNRRQRYNGRMQSKREVVNTSDIVHIQPDSGGDVWRQTPSNGCPSQPPVGPESSVSLQTSFKDAYQVDYEECDKVRYGNVNKKLKRVQTGQEDRGQEDRGHSSTPQSNADDRAPGYNTFETDGTDAATPTEAAGYESYNPDSVILRQGIPVSPQPRKVTTVFRKMSGRKTQKPVEVNVRRHHQDDYESYAGMNRKLNSNQSDVYQLNKLSAYEVPVKNRNNVAPPSDQDPQMLNDLLAYENETYVRTDVKSSAVGADDTVESLDAYENYNEFNRESDSSTKQCSDKDLTYLTCTKQLNDLDQYETCDLPDTGKAVRTKP